LRDITNLIRLNWASHRQHQTELVIVRPYRSRCCARNLRKSTR